MRSCRARDWSTITSWGAFARQSTPSSATAIIPGTRAACVYADVALIAIAINLIVLIATPLLRPDLNLLEKSLSYYAVGPWGTVQAAAFVAMGIASFALGAVFVRGGVASRWMMLVGIMLEIAGIASLGLVWYPMGAAGPATPLGDAHQSAGTIGAVAQLVAVLIMALAMRGDPGWKSLVPPTLITFLVSLAGAMVTQAAIWWPALGIPMGASMRLFVVPLVIFWGVVAWRLRRGCVRRATRSAAAR
jgi:hypothetical protein